MRLNLGCGPVFLPGYVNVDIEDLASIAARARVAGVPEALPVGVEFMQFDLGDPWPWADGSVEDILACELLEHLSSPTLTHVLAESRRTLQCGGQLRGGVPDYQRVWERYEAGDDWAEVPLWVIAGPYRSRAANALQNFAHGWGHQQVFTQAMLQERLEAAGFVAQVQRDEGHGLLFVATKTPQEA